MICGQTLNGYYSSSPDTFVATAGRFAFNPAVPLCFGVRGTWVILVKLVEVGHGFARYEVKDYEYSYPYFLVLPFLYFPDLRLPLLSRFKLLVYGRFLRSSLSFGIPEPISRWERVKATGVQVREGCVEVAAWWTRRRRMARQLAEIVSEDMEMGVVSARLS